MKTAIRNLLVSVFLLVTPIAFTLAQQIPDLDYNPPIANPAFLKDQGPRVGIDEGHNNFHTAGGRYQPFAQLLRRDGYVVQPYREKITQKSLEKIDVLVIANPIHEQNDKNWTLPTPSAYTTEEIESLLQSAIPVMSFEVFALGEQFLWYHNTLPI